MYHGYVGCKMSNMANHYAHKIYETIKCYNDESKWLFFVLIDQDKKSLMFLTERYLSIHPLM